MTRVMYGSTEAGPATTLADHDLERKPSRVGLPCAGVDLQLAANGEVCLRSDFLMSGYFEDEESTVGCAGRRLVPHRRRGSLDDDGYLSIVGRVRDVIRSGGETIAPVEVEAVVAEHPAVAEVAVIGLPDAEWGEVVCAVVVPTCGRARSTWPTCVPTAKAAWPGTSTHAGW